MKKHSLPSASGDTGWFFNLNKFEQQETEKQVLFKERHWPNLPDGAWSKRPNYYYPHILPVGHKEKAFYPEIADDIFMYCDDEGIAMHSEILNLRSSQATCFNFLFPLKMNLNVAKAALGFMLPNVTEVEKIEFEYTGGEEAKAWLGEPAAGRRGSNQTSIDAAIWWRDSDGKRILTLVEWKYTERSFGNCGGYQSEGNKDKQICRELDLLKKPVEDKCYLCQGKNTRTYWSHLQNAGIDESKLAAVVGCPFRGPFYQLMRQYLLRHYLEQHTETVDNVEVVVMAFKGNESLQKLPRHLNQLGCNVVEAWNNVLSGAPKLREVFADDLVSSLNEVSLPSVRKHAAYLEDRYGKVSS